MPRKAIIIGAGPAGLTAAYELLKRTDIKPIVLEKSGDIGGISKTINYKGNRMDMGPHRFFSKSDRVMNWWLNIMPLDKTSDEAITINYQNKQREINGANKTSIDNRNDKVMLVIKRLTRIYFLRKFFAYPIQLSLDTLRTLGLIRTIKILISFLWVRLFPRKPEKSLEDFIINKFGKQLYLLFFKDYTEKVWGVACNEISAEWGAQRIKGVSLGKAIGEAIKSLRKKKSGDIGQKGTETSLIEQFLYPKYGPGSLWEEVARQVEEMGGKIYLNQDVSKIYFEEGKIVCVNTVNSETGQTGAWEGDYFFSSMPVKELIAGMDSGGGNPVPDDVKEVAAGLQYRDFINVGILLKQLSKPNGKGEYEKLELKDNWIYIQERDVKVGRLMIYNNWGDGMIKDPNTTWIGMEYFCTKNDKFWLLPDDAIQRIAIEELEKMELANVSDVLDITVRRMEKTYPAYFGTYNQFDIVKDFVSSFENLFLVGRNGMHKYNNADHSMLTAMVAVDNICEGVTSKENIWAINTEQEYHEVKKEEPEIDIQSLEQKPDATRIEELVPEASFKDFIFKSKQNKWALSIVGVLILVQFIAFKMLYPFANFMPDSYSYIEAAWNNYTINMWPIGYSKFLRIFSALVQSDTALVLFQYLFLQAATLHFVFTLLYFLRPRNAIKYILMCFFVLNPLFLAISNYVSTDALFTAISLIWLVQLLWIIYRPKPYMIWLHAGLLLLAFMLRFNALYYPAIAVVVFILSKLRLQTKLAGIGVVVLLIALFTWHNSNQYKELTGQRQFAAFGSWQLASNAIYAYSHVASDKDAPPAQFTLLHKMVRHHLDSLSRVKKRPDSTIGIYYLWNGPLPQFLSARYSMDSSTASFKRYASIAPLYAAYAKYLIAKYPQEFLKYFLLPNVIYYSVPPAEFLSQYNMKADSVGKLAKNWFGYKSEKVKGYKKELKAFNLFPILNAIINAVFVLGIMGFVVFDGLKQADKKLVYSAITVAALWLINSLFSIIASPVVLRYQVFPMIVWFGFATILFDYIITINKRESK